VLGAIGPWIAFALGIACTGVSLLLTFASAPSYEPIFLAVLVLDVVALGLLGFLAGLGGHWKVTTAVPILAVFYTLLDIGLRYFAHFRFGDLI
jgi:hypothetical protein